MNLWEYIFYLAKLDKSILQHLYGIEIFNKTFGYGVIKKIDNAHIYVSFNNKPNCKYKYSEFPKLFDNLFLDKLPTDLKEELRNKSSGLRDPFVSIIFRIEFGETLAVSEINYILQKNAFELLGKYYEKNIAEDKWNILKAAKYYRKAHLIDKAFFLTDFSNIMQSQFEHHTDFKKFMAAVVTSHGACWRNYGNLSNAEQCAHDALKYQISFYPYNLLGAIYIEQGHFEEGDSFFQKAESLGSEKKDENDIIIRDQRSFIGSILKRSSKEEKKKIANYFYYRDSVKYAFLKSYL